MNPRDRIISRLADLECKRVSRKVIRALQRMTEGMQSGDDSVLANVWDEVCVQVQGQESVMWHVYLDTINSMIVGHLSELDSAVKQAIWLQTDAGMEWEPSEGEGEILYSDDDIASYILDEYVLSSAGDWTNERIEKYNDQFG